MKSSSSLPRLFLASQSPRRRQILDSLNLQHQVILPSVDEDHPQLAQNAGRVALENSEKKARNVVAKIKDDSFVVVAADTLVLLRDQVLGKPTNQEDARRMLTSLSGQTHRVVTGLYLLNEAGKSIGGIGESSVTFRKLNQNELDQYLSTKEPYDKAGSYAVQGLGALFIEKIEGSYTNVMGLPIETLLPLLEKLTGVDLPIWFQ